jgi:cobalamin biosynthetic protein CobC
VSSAALAIGAAALADVEWRERTRNKLAEAALRLDACLVKAGLEVIGGTSLFRLARSKDAGRLFQSLGEAGIMVRRFAEHPAWLRFGLPGSDAEWQRLEAALAAFERSPA